MNQRSLAVLGLLLAAALTSLAASANSSSPVNRAPLYWSAYEYCYTTDGYIPEATWSANIDWVERHLKPYGYRMICIDGWGDDSNYNEHGYRTTHSSEWIHDYAWWAKHLKSRGMTLGMYNNPLWINRAAANAGVLVKGTNIPLASLIDPNEEALWFTWVQVNRPGAEEYVKGYVQHYADMGVKYLRVDFLSWFEDGFDKNLGRVGPERPRADYEKALRWMKEACDANRMFLSLVMPHLENEAQLEVQHGHMFRINEDVATGGWERFSNFERGVRHPWWSQWYNTFDGFTYWSYLAGRNRVILDGDFLRVNTFATDDERKTAVSLSLMAGGPIAVADQHDTIGRHLWVYQNRELLALNEDGFVGKPLSNDPTDERSQIWKGRLSNGDWVVGLFNREDEPRARRIRFLEDLGIAGRVPVRDLWAHANLGTMTSVSATVPPHGCVMLRLGPPAASLQTAMPEFTPTGGVYATPQRVAMATTTADATIHYTLDGTEPTHTSSVYRAPIEVAASTTIKAFAVKDGKADSSVWTERYTIVGQAPLPAPWMQTDIGRVTPPGGAAYDNATGAFTNAGAGADIEGAADAFHFVYQPLDGDITLTARIASLTPTHPWAKAGLMIREGLEAGAANAMMAVTAASGAIFQRRLEAGGGTMGTVDSGAGGAPQWLRVQRMGDSITGYRSADGIQWTQVGPTLMTGSTAPVYVGLAVTSHADGTLAAAEFEQVLAERRPGSVAQPRFDPAGGAYPTVQYVTITTPTSGATIHYTLDGSTPSTGSPVYVAPLEIATTTTVKAIAVRPDLANSAVGEATYQIGSGGVIVSGGVYKIVARHSGKALDVSGVSYDNGALVHQWDYVGGLNQQWRVQDVGGGYYSLSAVHSGKVLDVVGGSTSEGAAIHQWDDYGLDSQKWSLESVGGGYFRIVNKNSAKALDIYGASTDNGAAVNQFTYTGGENQQWMLELLAAP
ncbi:MAG TPA: chitobiase/beta-hexosaminidase C-terminal domain-containing protein [Opitutaceae bacterium]